MCRFIFEIFILLTSIKILNNFYHFQQPHGNIQIYRKENILNQDITVKIMGMACEAYNQLIQARLKQAYKSEGYNQAAVNCK